MIEDHQGRGHEPLVRLDPSEDAIDLLDELEAKPDLLLLVPSRGLVELRCASRSILKTFTIFRPSGVSAMSIT